VQETAAALVQASTSTASSSRDTQPKEDLPCLPITGWKKFPSKSIPNGFCYGSIYEHIVSTTVLLPAGGNDGDTNAVDFSTGKPMRKGREYFRSGFVVDIEDCCRGQYYFVKAGVYASYRQNVYSVTVTIRSPSGTVIDASCECAASTMARCSHISSLLFAIEDYTIEFGFEPVSCTSQLCSWNRSAFTCSELFVMMIGGKLCCLNCWHSIVM